MGKLKGNSEFRKKLAAARPKLFRTAVVWTRNPELAEDLVQETISKGLRKAKQLRQIEALEAWLFRIMMNNWRDHIRRNPVTEDIDNHEVSTHHTPESENSRKETILMVRQAVSQLPESFRQTVTLVDLEGFSYIETSRILCIPVGTVMSRLSRARARLRDQLSRELKETGTLDEPIRRAQ